MIRDGPMSSLPMETHSNSPNHEDFAGVPSSKSGETELPVPPNRRPRDTKPSPSDSFGLHSPELVPLQSTGPDHVRSAETSASESASVGSVHKQIVETDFAELKDGTLIDLVRDSENPRGTLLAVWKDGDLRYLSQLEHDNYVLVPSPRKNEIFKRLRLPPGASPYESVQTLLSRIERLISRRVSIDQSISPFWPTLC